MINDISKKAHEYTDSAVKLLSELISFKSVMGAPEAGMPYGKDCAECLKYAAEVLSADGFKVRNFDTPLLRISVRARRSLEYSATWTLFPPRVRNGPVTRSRQKSVTAGFTAEVLLMTKALRRLSSPQCE